MSSVEADHERPKLDAAADVTARLPGGVGAVASLLAVCTVSFGLLVPWRLSTSTSLMLGVVNAIETAPFRVIRDVTSSVVHVPDFTEPDSPDEVDENAGAFAYVIDFSAHTLFATARTSKPTLELVLEYTWSVARVIEPVRLLKLNRTYVVSTGERSIFSLCAVP